MSIPEFTAQASLYRTSNRYRSPGFDNPAQSTVISPQLGGKEFKGMSGCIDDCLDKNPSFTPIQCRRSCSDPFGGLDLGTSRSWFNDFLSSAGIDMWEIGCKINPFSPPYACGWLANLMRSQS